MSNREFKRRYKPWITNGILNSISRKNTNRYSKFKDTNLKQQVFTEYKALRNTINELLRVSKKAHFTSFFTEHNNIKKCGKV